MSEQVVPLAIERHIVINF